MCILTEPKITSGQRSISVQTTERTAQMITRPVIMTYRVNTPINHICYRAMPGPAPVRRERGDRSIVRTYIYIVDRCFDARSLVYSRTALAIFHQNLFAAEVGVSPVMAAPGSLLTRGRKTVLVGS